MEIGQIRTDLALEARESLRQAETMMHGISYEEEETECAYVTRVQISTKNAEHALGKAIGRYVTLECSELADVSDEERAGLVQCIGKEIQEFLLRDVSDTILVVGLGNREVTADALGPKVLDSLRITRHLVKLYGRQAVTEGGGRQICCVEPGVMARTGMETLEIVGGVVDRINPGQVIVVDALAARKVSRLDRTIQITDTGIRPGSGVGNHRSELTRSTLGVPVIAVGIPTVVDAATIVADALEGNGYRELWKPKHAGTELCSMYMTGKNVDEVIGRVSRVLADGINSALRDWK